MSEHFTDVELKKQVCKEIANQTPIQDIMKKYNISEYYIRKWSGAVYKNMDMDHYVRYRFKWLVIQARTDIENSMANSMQEDETFSISDETWDKWGEIIKLSLYDLIKEVVKNN